MHDGQMTKLNANTPSNSFAGSRVVARKQTTRQDDVNSNNNNNNLQFRRVSVGIPRVTWPLTLEMFIASKTISDECCRKT